MVNPLESSPSTDHFDMTGNFSEDDIQHLLGVMNSSNHHHEVHHHTIDSSSSSSSAVPNPVVQAAVDAVAAACLPPSSNEPKANNSGSHSEIDEEAKAMARSERKRSREKQRRLDVNKQFTDLTKLITQIEQEEREEDPTVFRQSFSATNRADLIARTVSHLERLRDSNKRRKTECSTLQQQLQESQKAGEEIASKYKEALCKTHGMGMMPQQNKPVMMMVPMMMPANAAQGMPQFGMQAPMCNQYMMPQAFMAQPAAAAPPPAVPQVAQQQQQHQQAPAPAQQPQQHQPQHAQAPAPAAQPQMAVPTMMAPQQMMFTSMQSVYPTTAMVDPNATNAAMAAAAAAAATPQQQQAPPQAMPFMNFAMAPTAAAPAPVVEAKTGQDAQQQQQQQQQQQGPNGQGNSSAGGSNYAHCA